MNNYFWVFLFVAVIVPGAVLSVLEVAPEMRFDLSAFKGKKAPAESKKDRHIKNFAGVLDLESRAEILASAARRRLTDDPVEAFRLAEASILTMPNSKAESAIWKALEYPFYETILKPGGDILQVQFSPGGYYIAVLSTNSEITILNASTRKIIFPVIKAEDQIQFIDFSPGGGRLIGAGYDGRLKVWDVRTGACMYNLNHHTGRILDAAFSPDGKWIATASEDKRVAVLDTETYSVSREIRFDWEVSAVSFTPQSECLITVCGDNRVRRFAILGERGRVSPHLNWKTKPFRYRLRDVLVSPDNRHLMTLFMNKPPQIWDMTNSTFAMTAELGGRGIAYQAGFSSGGWYVVTANEGDEAHVWNAATGNHLYSLKGHRDAVLSAHLSPTDHLAATGSKDGTVRLWNLDTDLEKKEFKGHGGQVADIAFSTAGGLLLSASRDNTVRIWDFKFEKEDINIRKTVPGVSRVAFSPDNERFAAASRRGACQIWDRVSGIMLHSLEEHGGAVLDIEYSPDGRKIITGASDQTAILWDARQGKIIERIKGFSSPVIDVSFLFGQENVGCVTCYGTFLISPAGGDDIRFDFDRLSPGMTPFAVFPNYVLLTNTDGKSPARLWNISGAREVLELAGTPGEIRSAAVSPDEKYIAIAVKNRGIGYYHIPSGDLIHMIDVMDTDFINSPRMAFSPDGNYLAAVLNDHLIHAWPVHYSKVIDIVHQGKNRTPVSRMTEREIDDAVRSPLG